MPNLVLNSDLICTWARMQVRTHGIGGIISGTGRLSINYCIAPTEGPDTGTAINLNGATGHTFFLGTAGDAASTYQGGTDLRGPTTGGNVTVLRFYTQKVNALGTGRLFMNRSALDLNTFNQTVGGLSGSTGTPKITDHGAAGTTTLTLDFSNATGPFDFGGVISNGVNRAIALVKSNTGTQVLSGVNTFTGKTTISGGVLSIAAETGIGGNPGASAVDQLKLDGGTLQTTATFSIDDANRGITIGAPGGTFSPDSATALTVANVIAGTAGGSLVKAGAGTLTLSAANSYDGATTINAGVLQISASADRLPTGTAVTLANTVGAALDLNSLNQTIASLSGGGVAGGNVTLGSGTLTVGDANSTTYAGAISGATGNLLKQGAGTLTLSGSSSHGGTTTINNGTLEYGAANVLGDSSSVVVAGGSLSILGYSDTVAGVQLSSGSITGSGGTLTSSSAFDVQSGSATAILGGIAGLNKTGSGTVTLSGANSYSGETLITNGKLLYGASDVIAGGAVTVNGASAVLDLGSYSDTVGTVTVDGGGIITNGTGLTSTGSFALKAGSVYSVLAGAGIGLNKTSAGTVTLAAANTYSGSTTINNGTLRLASGGSIASSAVIDVQTNAFLDVTAEGIAIGVTQVLKGKGTVSGNVTNSGTLSPGASAGTLTISGDLEMKSGSTNLFEVAGTGPVDRLVVSGQLTYGGRLVVTALAGLLEGTYDLFDSGSHTGTFGDGIELPSAPSGLQWHEFAPGVYFDYSSGSIQLESAGGEATVPSLESPTADAIGPTNATLGATLISNGGDPITSWGTSWSTSDTGSNENLRAESGSVAGAFTQERTDLAAGTHCYAWGWASNDAKGIAFTATSKEFYTEPLPPSNVTFSSVTSTGMTVNWDAGNGAGRVVVMRQGAAPTGEPEDGSTYSGDPDLGSATALGDGKIVYAGSAASVAVTGLTRTSTYHVAVFEYAGAGALINYRQGAAASGSQATLPDVPVVGSPTSSGVGSTNAVLGATITDHGGSITSWGTSWSTNATGTNDHIQAEAGATNGAFSHLVSDLPSGSLVHAWGWASNAAGRGVSPTSSDFYTEPSCASAVTFSAVTSTGMTVSWTGGNGAGRLVVMKAGGAVTNLPTDSSEYVPSSVFGGGDDLGSGEYAVYTGALNTVTVSGLTRGATYHVAVFEYSGADGQINYQEDAPATNSQTTLTTPMTFIYAGADNLDMQWDEPTNYVGGVDFPRLAGDKLCVTNTRQANAYLLNGDRTLSAFLKLDAGSQSTGIKNGSVTSVLTWDTGVPGSNATFTVRAVGGGAELRTYTAVNMVLNSSLVWDGSTQREYADGTSGSIKGDISGSGALTVKWNKTKADLNNSNPMYLVISGGSGPNTYSGGTVFQTNSLGTRAGFRLNKRHATGTGNTTVKSSAEIYIPANAWAGGAINDSTSLYLEHSGSQYATVELETAAVNETVLRLYFDGAQQPAGTYGNTGSGADYPLPSWFAGSGVITVTENPLVVTNVSLSSVDTDQATVGVEVLGYNAPITSRGTVYGTSADPTGNAQTDAGTTTGTFSQVRTGLTPGLQYYFRGWASNATDGRVYSTNVTCYTEPLQDSAILFSSILSDRMTLSWTKGTAGARTLVLMKHAGSVTQAPVDGTEYTTSSVFGTPAADLGDGNYAVYEGTGSTVMVTGLTPEELYSVKLFACAGSNELVNYQQSAPPEGSESTVLITDPPTVSTPTVTNVTEGGATLGASVDYNGGTPITSYGTVWGTASMTTDNSLSSTGVASGAFTQARTGMPSATLIYARGWASNAVGATLTSEEVSFYTEPTAASGVTFDGVSQSGCTVHWTAGNGDGRLVVMRPSAAPSASPADGVAYSADSAFGSGDALGGGSVVYDGNGTSVSVTGLTRGRTYYVAVYEYIGAGALRNYQQDGPATGSQLTLGGAKVFRWDGPTTGTAAWNNPTNWYNVTDGVNNSDYPHVPGDVAREENSGTGTELDSITLELNEDITVGEILFTWPSDNSVYINAGVAGSRLIFDNGGSQAKLWFGDGDANPALRIQVTCPVVLSDDLFVDYQTSRNDGYFSGIVSNAAGESHSITFDVRDGDDSGDCFSLQGSSSNKYSGGTTVLRSSGSFGKLVLKKNGALGTGDVTVESTGRLEFQDIGATDDMIANGASVNINFSGANSGMLILDSGVVETVSRLYVNGGQCAGGTWGSSSSAADHVDDTRFSGAGVLRVLEYPHESLFKWK